jgi:hypothetical protein
LAISSGFTVMVFAAPFLGFTVISFFSLSILVIFPQTTFAFVISAFGVSVFVPSGFAAGAAASAANTIEVKHTRANTATRPINFFIVHSS